MPFGDEERGDDVGLALSGGGFRATLFHIGAIQRLVEMGLLAKLTRISSVSGGSIVAGRLAEVWSELAADPSVATFNRLVAEPLRAFCRMHIDVHAIGKGILSPFSSAADEIEQLYARNLMAKRLDEMPDKPVFVFNSTNMQTGRSFRFTKAYLADFRLGLIRNPALPIAKAVTASSAFPPFLSPVILDKPGTFEAVDGADLNADPAYTGRLAVADGGIYDNLGLETVWKRCATLYVSDAGAPFATGPAKERDWLHQTLRALDVATDQARGLRKRALVSDYKSSVMAGAYWGIDTDIANYTLADALSCDPAKVRPLAQIRTRLDPFTDEEQGQLINWGYALADAAIRRHAPGSADSGVPPSWPCAAYPLA